MLPSEFIPVSPLHKIKLASAYLDLVEHAPERDYVIRTLARREASGLPLMAADLVIAGRETREKYPLAAGYPVHFRKTYFPGRLHGDPSKEYEFHSRAAKILDLPPPIGHAPREFRACFLPGTPYNRLSPFGKEPEESNLATAREIHLAHAAGLWQMMESAFSDIEKMHSEGMVHGDAELHNLILCPAPIELLVIDFENARDRSELADDKWDKMVFEDRRQILREAIFLQCALGKQNSPLAVTSLQEMDNLFQAPKRFKREIDQQADV